MDHPRKTMAAQYLRMSTDGQQYSMGNQAAAIAGYAAAEGLEIVATYKDAGKSGVTAEKRDGLQALLRDALSGAAPFGTVLVLDVSRWGRFQDPDEAAHYEFICRSVGIDVRYCGEAFEPGPSGSIMKQLKRVMAGEYSRELSNKTRFGQCRQADRGFVIGGVAPYGYRRQSIGPNGPGAILNRGEQRARVTDAVRWTLGPADEIAQVCQIFDLYVRKGIAEKAIADRLNAEGKLWQDGTPWQRHRVKNVLQCELVIGNYVYGKRIQFLNSPSRWKPISEWKRSRMVEPILSPALFAAAQQKRAARERRQYTDERLLSDLRSILRRKKALTAELITASRLTASIHTYAKRFGSLEEAYHRIGYNPANRAWLRRPDGRRKTPDDILADLRALYEEKGTINGRIINADKNLPSLVYFTWHFGSLSATYAAAGIEVVGLKSHARKLTGIGWRFTDREKRVVEALKENGSISVTETMALLHSSWKFAQDILERLQALGIVARGRVAPKGSTKRYRLLETAELSSIN